MEEIMKSWEHKRDSKGDVVEFIKSPKIYFDYIEENYMLTHDKFEKGI